MTKRSLIKQMEGSDYKRQVSQWTNDVESMSNCEKRNNESKRKEMGVNCNNVHLIVHEA